MCGRVLLREPAAVVRTSAGPAAFGPKCAALKGLMPKREAPKRSRCVLFARPRNARTTAQIPFDFQLLQDDDDQQRPPGD